MARLILPLLCGTLAFAVLAGVDAIHAQTSTVTAGPSGVSGGTTAATGPNGKPCRVVHSDDAKSTGALSSSVTAGPGGVRGSTTGGPSVTVRSSDGSSGSTTSSSASSTSGTGGTTVTTGDGDCVVTVPKSSK